ncbi:MAG: hypothetical protein WB767_07540 [Nocardioides sp.]
METMSGRTSADLRTTLTARHPANIGHLVMGIAFLGLTGIWALVTGDVVTDDNIRWLLPLPWVLAGIGGLVALVSADRRRLARPADRLVDPSDTMER